MVRFASLVFVILLFTGCSTQTFYMQPNSAAALNQAELEQSQPFFIGGIGQEDSVNAAEVCGGAANVLAVQTEQAALDVLLSYITGSIYAPRTARVYCL